MNKSLPLRPSALLAASGNSAEIENDSSNSAAFIIDITAIAGTTPSVVVTVEGFDPVSGKWYVILASAALGAVSTTVLRVGAGLTAAANLVANDLMPKLFRLRYTLAGSAGPSVTFSVGANLTD